MDCPFCQMAAGTLQTAVVWEDERHLAFLSAQPNTEGFTVVIPRRHFSSYLFDMPDADMHALIDAAGQVARRLDAYFADVGRTGLIFEGFGVDHVHAKLVPMHGTADTARTWRRIASDHRVFFERYPGYISSHDGPYRVPLEQRQRLAAAIASGRRTRR